MDTFVKKIAIVTTSRADYGLLKPLLAELSLLSDFQVDLVATGTHLSIKHGMTITNILEDGCDVNERIEMNSIDDTEYAICNSIAQGMIGFASLYQRKRYDLVIVLGDRYELWAVCVPAVIYKIPIAHIHGGELTNGAIDNVIRHSITKMASLHFASTDTYARRIIQMGEQAHSVFSVGAIGIDNIKNIPLMEIDELIHYTKVDFRKKVALLTFHPVTLDSYSEAQNQINEVFSALSKTDLVLLITMPNSDTGSDVIINTIKSFVQGNPEKMLLIPNLGQRAYLSAMKYAKLMIGNSSSGIIEAASFKLPVVNIGDRQTGREKPLNVIDCDCKKDSIEIAISIALSAQFKKEIEGLINPYEKHNAARNIAQILSNIDFTDKVMLKKKFYDILVKNCSDSCDIIK